MTVIPPGDTPGVSTQLRLVEPPGSRPAPKRTRRARVVPAGRARRGARWSGDWRLDAKARRVGQEGVAAARQALARANGELPKAS